MTTTARGSTSSSLCAYCSKGKYSLEGECQQCPFLRTSAEGAPSLEKCVKVLDDTTVNYLFGAAFAAVHVITYVAFVVASGWEYCPDFGVNLTGWVMVELALVDAFMDYYYYFTEPFANESLHYWCGVFLLVPQILPAIACFCCVTYYTFMSDQRGNQMWQMPFDWTPEDMGDIVKVSLIKIKNPSSRSIQRLSVGDI